MKKSEQTKLKILSATCELFCEKGYSATSTSEIAKKAEVSEGTIFRYFNTKKELLIYIITYGIEMFADELAIKPLVELSKRNKYDSVEKFLYELVIDRYKFMKEHKSIIMIFINELSYHNEIQELFKKNIGDKINNILCDALENYISKELFRQNINLNRALRYFTGMLFIIFLEEANGLRNIEITLEDDIKSAIDIFLNGIKK